MNPKNKSFGCERKDVRMKDHFEKEVWRGGNMLYPEPAVIVSCGTLGEDSDASHTNLITIGWTGTACSDPPMTYISIRKERFSHDIVDACGEFVINLVSEDLARACDLCGVLSGRDTDKWKAAGLTPAPASEVKAPLIAESPVSLECKVTQKLELGSHDMYLAEIVAVDVARDLLDEKGRFRLEDARLIAYLHGHYYGLGQELGKFGFSVKKK